MTNILVLYFGYILITFSIIGFGYLSSKILSIKLSVGELGLSGILLMTILSYITNLFLPHNYIHNSFFLLIGLFYFYRLFKKKLFQKKIKLILLLSTIIFVGILLYKNHDDFFYYHFPYTISLIEFKKIFGLGNLEHGFRTASSIFYFNSLFYLPFLNKALINSGAIFFLLFTNLILIEKIFNKLKNNKKDFILILALFSIVFINTIFYRIAEHGTDRSALILIFILAIYYLESMSKKINKINFFHYFGKILFLLTLIASLKSFYLIYFIFIFTIFFEHRKILLKENFYLKLLKEKIFYYFLLSTLIFVLTVFSNTGCFIYPASFTCLDTFSWSIPKKEVIEMKTWYELWSKAGASPNYRVENYEFYVSGFNWIPNWIENYFFNKVSDFLLSLFVITIICIFFLKGKNQIKLLKKKNNIFYFTILILLFEWFFNHPALRYGGFTLIALSIFIPLSNYLEKKIDLSFRLKKKIITLILLSFSFFLLKNINRIFNEYKKYNYNPLVDAHYYIDKNTYHFNKLLFEAKKYKNSNQFYIVLNRDLIKKIQSNK